jgi:iron(III) transport system permease protein
MILVALLLSWVYVRVISQSHKYSVVTGKNYRPRTVELGRWWFVGWFFIGTKLLLGVVLPFLALVWASLIPYFQPFSLAALDVVSLENFHRIPWDRFWAATKNTAILTLTVPTLLVLIGLVISWVVIRSGSKYAGFVDTVAFLPHAVPNLIFSVAILIVALSWLPEFIPFYNTIYILIASFVIARISFPTRVYNNALLQIHKELDEAAYVSGLGTLQVLRHVLIPLLRPATVYAWIWLALLSYRELTLAAFLTARTNQTLPTLILSLVSAGQSTIAAAVSLLLFLFMIPLVILYFFFGRRSFQVGDH